MPKPKNHKAIDEVRRATERTQRELDENYLSPSDASTATGRHVKTIRKAIVAKRITARNDGTEDRPRYRIHKDDLKKWMKVA